MSPELKLTKLTVFFACFKFSVSSIVQMREMLKINSPKRFTNLLQEAGPTNLLSMGWEKSQGKLLL